jgi:hypothetical protein
VWESNNPLEMYDSPSSLIWSIVDIRQADNELILTVALIERWPVNNLFNILVRVELGVHIRPFGKIYP